MKRSKKIGVLLTVLAGACAATVGVMQYEEQKEAIKNTEEVILQMSPERVTALSWEYGTEHLAFHRDEDESWKYDEDEAFPVDEQAIADLLAVFEEFGASFVIEDVEDFAQYGLDDPTCEIRLTGAEAEDSDAAEADPGTVVYEIKLGNYSNMDSKRYVSIGDGNVYLMAEDPFETYEVTISDMILHDDTSVIADVEEIAFAGREDYRIVREDESRTYSEEDVYYAHMNGETLPLDTTAVDVYVNELRTLQPENYVNYKVTDDELADYGLDEPEFTVTVHYTDEEEADADTFVMQVGRSRDEVEKAQKEAKREAEGDAGEAEKTELTDNASDAESLDVPAYVRIGESAIIYEITAEEYETLTRVAYDDLRHEEVFWAEFADVTRVDIQLEDDTYTFTAEEPLLSTDTVTWKYGDEEIEIDGFRTALLALQAEQFSDREPDGKLELALTIALENEQDPEVSVELYRYDGSFCLAVVDDTPVSLIPREQVVDLAECIRAVVLK